MAEKSITRRDALRRLGFGVLAAYVVPEILVVSTAAASSTASHSSEASGASSDPSTASDPSRPEASLPSGPSQADWRDDDTCNVRAPLGNQVTISNSDFRRAQRAVARGEALPLRDVFQSVQQHVRGQFIQVRFSNAGVPPIYQFRMVTERGKLITVFTDASSAEIIRIVNC